MSAEIVQVDGVPRWFMRLHFLIKSQSCNKYRVHDKITNSIKVGDLDTTETFRNRVACGYCGLVVWKKSAE